MSARMCADCAESHERCRVCWPNGKPAPADAAPVSEPRPCCERTERETVARVVKMLWRRAAKAEELAEECRLALDFKGRDDWEEHAAALRIFADDLEREGVRRG